MKQFFAMLLALVLVLSVMLPALAEEQAEDGEIDWEALLALVSDRGEHYWDFTATGQPLEKKYTALGEHEVEYAEFALADEQAQKMEVWYPADPNDQESWPVVIFVNGTGAKASGYQANFRHMASWGFIAVGNEDENTRTGASAEATLTKLLSENENPDSVLYGKIDPARIGLTGHSQGGVGVFNAAAKQPHGSQYAALFTVSGTSPYWGQEGVFGLDWAYDLTDIHVPVFMGAGTGYFDAGTADSFEATEGQGICPLWALEMNFQALPDTIVKGYARKADIDHGDTLNGFDGYMTAWFLWHLCGDGEAAQVYTGENPELAQNSLYQDVVIDAEE